MNFSFAEPEVAQFPDEQKIVGEAETKQGERAYLPTVESAEKRFAAFKDELEKMKVKASAIQIGRTETKEAAVTMAAQAKGLHNRIENLRKEIVLQPDTFVRKINAFCKPFRDVLKGIENDIKRKIAYFEAAEEIKRKAAEKKAEEERKKLQEQLNHDAAAQGVAPVVLAPSAPAGKDTIIRTEAGTAHTARRWTYEIVNLDQVPGEYVVRTPDRKKLQAAVDMGIRDIPGVRIYQDATIHIKAR